MYDVTDPEVKKFLDSINKPISRSSDKTSMKYYLEFTGKTGKELLEIKKTDKDFQVEKLMLHFKK